MHSLVRILTAAIIVAMTNLSYAAETFSTKKLAAKPLDLSPKGKSAMSKFLRSGLANIQVSKGGDSNSTQSFGCGFEISDDIFCGGGGWIGSDWSGDYGGGYVELGIAKLPRQTVEGTSVGGIAVCIDSFCSFYAGIEVWDTMPVKSIGGEGLVNAIIDWFLPRIPVDACQTNHPIPGKNKEAKNTTSRDSPELRGVAADSIIRGTGQSVTASGREFKVTYSDGGSETIKFNYYGTTQVAEGKDYVPGSGRSACPIP